MPRHAIRSWRALCLLEPSEHLSELDRRVEDAPHRIRSESCQAVCRVPDREIAYRKARLHFSPATQARRIEEIYREVLDRKKAKKKS